MAAVAYRVACLTGCGTAPELMAEASRALDATARLHGLEIEQSHAPVGADALVRHGQAVSHTARSAYLGADAVLLADEDDDARAELASELDLRARQTRVEVTHLPFVTLVLLRRDARLLQRARDLHLAPRLRRPQGRR